MYTSPPHAPQRPPFRGRSLLTWIALGAVAACSTDAPTALQPDLREQFATVASEGLTLASSHGATLYSIQKRGDLIREIDPATGATIGSPVTITVPGFTVESGNGLATDPNTGVLYAVVRGGGASHLATVDPITGAGSLIGDLGDSFSGIAFTCDALYGVTGDGADTPESFYRIDPATAATTYLTALGNGNDGEAIAYNPDDELMYHASGFSGGEIWETIDLNTLAVTGIFGPRATTYREAFGLTYDAGGTFLVSGIDDGLHTLTSGGTDTRLGDMDHESKGLAFVPTFSCDHPPVADAGEDRTVEWSDAGVELDGSGSSDPDMDPLTYSWSEGGSEIATGVNPTVVLSLGTHVIALTVEANGVTDSDEVEIEVVDTTPPDVWAMLEPVDGKSLKSKKGVFTVHFSCADGCDADPSVTMATLNGVEVENGQVVDLRLKSKKSDKSAKSEKSKKSKRSKKSEKPVKIEGVAEDLVLVVVCEDASGNVGEATAVPGFAPKKSKKDKGG